MNYALQPNPQATEIMNNLVRMQKLQPSLAFNSGICCESNELKVIKEIKKIVEVGKGSGGLSAVIHGAWDKINEVKKLTQELDTIAHDGQVSDEKKRKIDDILSSIMRISDQLYVHP